LQIQHLKTLLGQPAYERDGVALYQGDCLELMAKIEVSAIDLTITSPPYNIGKEYETKLELTEYLRWVGEWSAEISRVTSDRGQFWLNLGYVEVPGLGRAVPLPYMLWDKIPFYLRQEVIWAYGAGTTTSTAFAPRNEKFLWYMKNPKDYTFNLDAVRDPDVKYPNQKKNGKIKVNPLGKNPGDVWYLPKVTSGSQRSSKERMPHPAQFPEAVIERIMLASSNAGELVLDPFMGSGTTAAVAARLGRQCVGFELRTDYIKTAAARIDAVFDAQAERLFSAEDDGKLGSVNAAG
jgi:adenine-specific DNA-methyltransferase